MKIHTLNIKADAPSLTEWLILAHNEDQFHARWDVWRHHYTNYDKVLGRLAYNGKEYIQFMRETHFRINQLLKVAPRIAEPVNTWFTKKITKAETTATLIN